MPITQDRMLALVASARAFYSYAMEIRAIVGEEIGNVLNGSQDAKKALDAIENSIAVVTPPLEHVEVIAREEAHFRIMKHRNKRTAGKMREMRYKRETGMMGEEMGFKGGEYDVVSGKGLSEEMGRKMREAGREWDKEQEEKKQNRPVLEDTPKPFVPFVSEPKREEYIDLTGERVDTEKL